MGCAGLNRFIQQDAIRVAKLFQHHVSDGSMFWDRLQGTGSLVMDWTPAAWAKARPGPCLVAGRAQIPQIFQVLLGSVIGPIWGEHCRVRRWGPRGGDTPRAGREVSG